MKRHGGAWRRYTVQAGVLAGIGLAFVGGSRPPLAAPPPGCVAEGMCAVKKPLLLFVLDYSTSMNKDLGGQGSRWENTVDAVKSTLVADNGFLISRFVLGLMRFGHDPLPLAAGTKIANDSSGIVDGFRLDVPFYDPGDPEKEYGQCAQGDAIVAALDAVPAPLGGNLNGIYPWTRGALLAAKATFAAALADHPDDGVAPARLRSIVLLTDGPWTNPQGNMILAPATENPALVAADLFNNFAVPTHVVAIGEAVGEPFADEIAAMGGTGAARDAATPIALVGAFAAVHAELGKAQGEASCESARPRVMILLDASSSMLNLQGGFVRAPMGQGGWEQARESLAGDVVPMFEYDVAAGKVGELMHFGLAVYGHDMPDESKLLVQYGPCRYENFKWALDPESSCAAPGCSDPWANAPITWTFQDGSMVDPPGFDTPTLSHMPTCNKNPNPGMLGCVGSGTYTHLGLLRVRDNIAAYKAACADPDAAVRCGPDTPFVNILIADGMSNSTQAQYAAPLVQMHAEGITTYVIGFGDLVDSPNAIANLQDLADKGSGGALDYLDANNQTQLETHLSDILEGLALDPCCGPFGCAMDPPIEPEPDPVPPETSSSSESSSGGSSSSGEATSTDTTGTSGTTEAASTGGSSSGGALPGTTTTGEPTPTSGAEATSTGGVTTTGDAPTGGGPSGGEASAGEGGSESGTSAGSGVEAGGCGCATVGGTPGWLVLAGLGLRRRRR